MTDDELILSWLGYTPHGKTAIVWIRFNEDVYNRVIDLNRERKFLAGQYQADPELDYLVLVKMREVLCSQRWRFEENLDAIWQARIGTVGRADPFDALVIGYRPGDYAEAARFLWTPNAAKTDDKSKSKQAVAPE